MRTRTRLPTMPPDASGWPRTLRTPPLRALECIAPSGAGGWLTKVFAEPGEVGFGSGNLTPVEHNQFWKAKNLILRGGLPVWDQARAQLLAAGWLLTVDQ